MGWTVLYIAFGVVALWLLGEVLLQYKARLRWRLLAFVGFLGVVVGVLLPSVPVIGVGAAAFAVGQTCVTLSFRRGFSTGWAIGGSPGTSRRRRAPEPSEEADQQEGTTRAEEGWAYAEEGWGPAAAEGQAPQWSESGERSAGSREGSPSPEYAGDHLGEHGTGYGYGPVHGHGEESGGRSDHRPDEAPVYRPEPMPDDTGQYGVYSDSPYSGADHTAERSVFGEYQPADYGHGGHGYDGYIPDSATAHAGQDPAYGAPYGHADPQGHGYYGGYSDGYREVPQDGGLYSGQASYEAQTPYDAGYHQQYGEQYGTGQPSHTEPSYGEPSPYAEQYYTGQHPHEATTAHYDGPYADPAAQQYPQTPPGGVWIPPQRGGEDPRQPAAPAPQESAYPYRQGYEGSEGHHYY
ncbi:hypothetical protein [Streptomyces sp. TP-A0874]|uniref:hypothetical protein n=1 Tax=Streptomyces sp. TP-A0874 TaxID=549819 RepID=UPI000853E0B5|nr:hypothetical protein [Streptomyces sp. TP-A0874]